MTTPVFAPSKAQPSASNGDAVSNDSPGTPIPHPKTHSTETPSTETLSRPFRLGLVGFGAAVGLFVRLLAANNYGELDSQAVMLGAAVTSGLMGLGLLLMAAERDRFGPPLAWISVITSLAWGALNWISPPFAPSVTVWSKPDQVVLAALGLGNGLLLAGIVALAFVRRHPTLSVGATTVGSVFALVANTIVLRDEWPAIISLGIAFALILLAWDRSPRRELTYIHPKTSSRVSRASLSFISVALCGTAIQLWTSRTDIPRSMPAVIVCGLLVIGAFVSLVGVRREIENRETTLSEWTSWAREIRTNDFRSEMQNFESATPAATTFDSLPPAGVDGEAPRKLSFPNLSIPDGPEASAIVPDIAPTFGDPIDAPATIDVPDAAATSGLRLIPDVVPADETSDTVLRDVMFPETVTSDSAMPQAQSLQLPRIDIATADAPTPEPSGAFSAMLAAQAPDTSDRVQLADVDTLGAWLSSPVAAARTKPLLVAIEAMSLDEFESLPPADATMATEEIGSFLADIMPDADLVSWIDGPYFIIAHASKPESDLGALNNSVRKSLKATDGMLAFLRPGPDAVLDDMVNDAVVGLLHARRAEERATGR